MDLHSANGTKWNELIMESEVYQLILGDRVSFANLQAVYLKDTQNMPDVPQRIMA